ncbi:MAG: helix-hairpin-helix domain-containing protein [Melioribacteraceae bacterium]|nr:helix-hairpin-helix domain-containing protein [Melioribacteraceae bacterium]MCF8263266.1 helix-hairpin-helix domain-containing protein [Melioribacteraceae bacterium]MCF8412863.1 helix-hairpin-helix domain-containing protein [Melioribacteraceae bacterium]MCF8430706.1 helix-hairpin-helix domain-containing protein [Melioribacteraceae bacterium]
MIFICGLVILGSGGFYLKYQNEFYEYKEFDYSEQDSLFFAADSLISADSSSKIVEKGVDSKQELLDFTPKKFDQKKSENFTLKLNLNTATKEQLIKLPGVGVKTAESIIEFRKMNGNFSLIEQLMEVKGIGEAKFHKLKDYIFIEQN